MTKEEKNKEAYGEHWEKVKYFIDKNGWLDARSFYGEATHKGLVGLTMEISDPYDPKYCYWKRPIGLKGIENNNGWIKIESETDFPEEGNYWVFNEKMNHVVYSHFDSELKFRYGIGHSFPATHYQPIEKPKPPIY